MVPIHQQRISWIMLFSPPGLGSQTLPQFGALFAGGQAVGDPEEPSSHEL